jgi:hypothetical protein
MKVKQVNMNTVRKQNCGYSYWSMAQFASGEYDEELTKEAELSINPMQIIFDSCEKINKLFLLYLIVTDFYDFTLTGLLL